MVEYQIPYRNNWTTAAHCLCLIHPIDQRGGKIGGIETHVRLLLQHEPGNCLIWTSMAAASNSFPSSTFRRRTFTKRQEACKNHSPRVLALACCKIYSAFNARSARRLRVSNCSGSNSR